jgi:phospholipid transport system transporter-binding protein
VLAGEVTHATVPALHGRALQMAVAGDIHLDLSGMERIDSAALALLLSLARRCQRAGGRLRILNPPSGLVALAGLCGVRTLLGLEAG